MNNWDKVEFKENEYAITKNGTIQGDKLDFTKEQANMIVEWIKGTHL